MTLWEQFQCIAGIAIFLIVIVGIIAGTERLFKLRAQRRLRRHLNIDVPFVWSYSTYSRNRLHIAYIVLCCGIIIWLLLQEGVLFGLMCCLLFIVAGAPLLFFRRKTSLKHIQIEGRKWTITAYNGEIWQWDVSTIQAILFYSFRSAKGPETYIPCASIQTMRCVEPVDLIMLTMTEYIILRKYVEMYGINVQDTYSEAIGMKNWLKS